MDMKLGPVSKHDKRNKTTSKKRKIDNAVMSQSCDVIVIFLIYSQFGGIPNPDYGRIVCKTYIFINSDILS